jgi:hypothetical protein
MIVQATRGSEHRSLALRDCTRDSPTNLERPGALAPSD